MSKLKANWAQIVCWVVVVASLGWAGFTVYASGLDDTKEERGNRDTVSDVKNWEGKIEGGQAPEIKQLLTPKPAMLPAKPAELPTPASEVTSPPHSFYVTNTPVKSGIPDEIKPPQPGDQLKPKDVRVPAYILPAHLEVYQVSTGNELVVYLPWPEDRSMMAITGFVLQRMEMRKDQKNNWVPKDKTWVNLPKYMVADETKAGAAAPTVPVGPAAPVAPVAPVRPAGLMGGGAAGPAAGGLPGAGGLGGGATAASSFDMKKFQGVYVIFDKVVQDELTRYNYRVAMLGKQIADAVEKDIVIDSVPFHAIPFIPAEISKPYAAGSNNLIVFAPGDTVEPSFTGKIQVKFVSGGEDPAKANFMVIRGLSQSAIVEVKAGEEIAAELPVVDEKGRPVIDEGGNKKETLQSGLTFEKVEADATTKKNYALLTDAKGAEIKIEQGKTNGNPKEPEIDLKLLNSIQTEREKEYKKLFNTTWDKCDIAVPVPEKSMNEAKGELQLKPNEFFPSKEDEITPSSPWPQITMSPREHKIVRIPVTPRPQPVVPPTFVRPAVPPPVPPPQTGPPERIMEDDNPSQRVKPEFDKYAPGGPDSVVK